jgi:serine/threonine protein kinase
MPSTFQIDLPERYTLRGHIANGGMAGVWSAEDELLARPVAIKVLAAHLAEDAISATRFQREARAAARLSSHPNVVTVYDVGEHAGRAFIVMECLQGGTVADRLRAGRPARRQALTWLRDAAAALDYAHERGVVDRDVKPGNLLLDEHDRVRVADFGIARVATDDTVTGTGQLLGTAAYLSPEQVEGDPTTPASDRYALAVVAFELLTGTRPFGGEHLDRQAAGGA